MAENLPEGAAYNMPSPPPSGPSTLRTGSPPHGPALDIRTRNPFPTFGHPVTPSRTPYEPLAPLPLVKPYVGEERVFKPQEHPAWYSSGAPLSSYPKLPPPAQKSIPITQRPPPPHPPSPPSSRGQPSRIGSITSSGRPLTFANETQEELLQSRSVRGSTSPNKSSRRNSGTSVHSAVSHAGSDGGDLDGSESVVLEGGKARRTRALMTRRQSAALFNLWRITKFPSGPQREELGGEVGLTPRQVQVWFQNQRQKFRRHTLQFGGVPEGENPDDYKELLMSPRSRKMSQDADDKISIWASTSGGGTFSSIAASTQRSEGYIQPPSRESSHPYGRPYSDHRIIIGSAHDGRHAQYSVPPPQPPHTIRSIAASNEMSGLGLNIGSDRFPQQKSYSYSYSSGYSNSLPPSVIGDDEGRRGKVGGSGNGNESESSHQSRPPLYRDHSSYEKRYLEMPVNTVGSRYPELPRDARHPADAMTRRPSFYSPPSTAPAASHYIESLPPRGYPLSESRPQTVRPNETRVARSASPEIKRPPSHLPPSLAAIAISRPIQHSNTPKLHAKTFDLYDHEPRNGPSNDGRSLPGIEALLRRD